METNKTSVKESTARELEVLDTNKWIFLVIIHKPVWFKKLKKLSKAFEKKRKKRIVVAITCSVYQQTLCQ